MAITTIYNSRSLFLAISWLTVFGSNYLYFCCNYYFVTTIINNYFVFRFGSVTNGKSDVNMLCVFPIF